MASKAVWKRVFDGELAMTPEGLEKCRETIARAVREMKERPKGSGSWAMPSPADGLAIIKSYDGQKQYWRIACQIWLGATNHQLSDMLGKPGNIGEYPAVSLMEAIAIRDAYCREYAIAVGYDKGASTLTMRNRAIKLYESTHAQPDPAKMIKKHAPDPEPEEPEDEPEEEEPEPEDAELQEDVQEPQEGAPEPVEAEVAEPVQTVPACDLRAVPEDFWKVIDALNPFLRRLPPADGLKFMKAICEVMQ